MHLPPNHLRSHDPQTKTAASIKNEMLITAKPTNPWINEPPHDKTNKIIFAPSENYDQPGHPPSLIRVFAVRMKKHWVLSYPLSALQRLIRLGGCPSWSESSLGAQTILLICHEAVQMPKTWSKTNYEQPANMWTNWIFHQIFFLQLQLLNTVRFTCCYVDVMATES